MMVRAQDIAGPLRMHADVCIIGSGCGGGPSAKVLAEAGKNVVVIEEGPYVKPEEFIPTEEWAYTHLYQQRAGQATDDLSVTVLQGKSVGGSTTINWMTSLRTPEFVLDAWSRSFGLTGMSPKEMEPYFARVETYWNIQPEPDDRHNRQNRIILDGARNLGWHAQANGRNARECVQLGVCGLGCPAGAKLSVDTTYIPDAIKAGATVLSNCRAESIVTAGPMKRVSGMVVDPESRSRKTDFIVEAPVVIVAGSAVQSPVLLERSGIASSNPHLGRHLTFHLTTAVLGTFDEPVHPWKGIPQSAMCDEFLNKNGDGGGFWMEAVPATPALAGIALPGFGAAHRRLMQRYPHIGATIILVKEVDSEGRVTANEYGRPSMSYDRGPRDLDYLKQGIRAAAELQFAAGAREVRTLHTRPTVFRSPAGIGPALEQAEWGTNDIGLYSAHPLGTCRMGTDPRNSVIDVHGQVHGVKGVFVIDGSFTPTSLGVNPQVTLVASAEKNAEWVADNFRSLVA